VSILFKPYQKLFLVLSLQTSSEEHPFWASTDGYNIPSRCYDIKPVKVNVNTQSKKLAAKNSVGIVSVIMAVLWRLAHLQDMDLRFCILAVQTKTLFIQQHDTVLVHDCDLNDFILLRVYPCGLNIEKDPLGFHVDLGYQPRTLCAAHRVY
jgi:hypothetical protein